MAVDQRPWVDVYAGHMRDRYEDGAPAEVLAQMMRTASEVLAVKQRVALARAYELLKACSRDDDCGVEIDSDLLDEIKELL